MKITVLSGSPKGDKSISLQYAKYIRDHFPDHDWKFINIGTGIRKLKSTPEAFSKIIDEVKSSDAVLWTFPLYYMLVPGQMKHFIELIYENKTENAFHGKYASTITTSIHFCDNFAQNYMNAVSDDFGMKYITGFSAEMHDLLKAEGRLTLLSFAEKFLTAVESKHPTTQTYAPVSAGIPEYKPGDVSSVEKSRNEKIVLVTDTYDSDTNLGRMIDAFVKQCPSKVDIVNLSEVDIKGGCLGCLNCSFENICVYHDGFFQMFEEKIKTADALILAGSIRDRYLSSGWKIFFDRSFYNGHIPVHMGKQMAMIISGPLRQNSNLRDILDIYAQMSDANLVGIVTDEYDTSSDVTERLKNLGEEMLWAIQKKYIPPNTYLGVARHLLFRDFLVHARFPFAADHKFFKKHGLYDFPQKNIKRRMMTGFLSLLAKMPGMKKNIQKTMTDHMLKPYLKHLKD